MIISGPTTGVVETRVEEIRLDLAPVPQAVRGDICSIPVHLEGEGLVRRGDKVYLWVES